LNNKQIPSPIGERVRATDNIPSPLGEKARVRRSGRGKNNFLKGKTRKERGDRGENFLS